MGSFNSRLRQYRRLALDLFVVVGAIISVVAVVFLLNLGLTDPSRTKGDVGRIGDVAGIVQLSAAAVIIVAGGVFAYRKLQLFRDFEPHLTVTHSLSHRPIGTRYVHIHITAALHNSSKVKVEIHEAFFRLMQVAPMDDHIAERLYADAFDQHTGDILDVQWPMLDVLPRASGTTVLTIEPGETHYEPGEFIVSNEVTTVLLYSYFYNSAYSEGSRSAPGWTVTTVYDIV